MSPPVRVTPATGQARRRAGRALVGLGRVGIGLSLVATVVGWVLVDAAVDSVEDSVELTDEALVAVAETVDVAGEALGRAGGGLVAVRSALGDVDVALGRTGTVLTVADGLLAETVPGGIDAVPAPLPALIRSSDVLSRAVSGPSTLGVDFRPETSPAESLRAIDTELGDLAARLRDPDVRPGGVVASFGDVSAGLGQFDRRLGRLIDTVERADAIVGNHAVTTSLATELVDDAVADLDGRRRLARLLVVLFGAVAGLAHAAPIIVGRHQAEAAATAEVAP